MFQLLRRHEKGINNRFKQPSIIESSRFKSAIDDWYFPIKWSSEEISLKDIPLCISVGGGKGGVGKTLVSSNLAFSLAESGYSTLVVDLDLGCSNLHSHFKTEAIKANLNDFLTNPDIPLAQVIADTKIPNLKIIAGGGERKYCLEGEAFNRGVEKLYNKILMSRQSHGFDIVIFDLGAGIHSYTLDFFLASHLGILTALPESTSIENAYTFLKQYMWKMMDNIAEKIDAEEDVEDLKDALVNSHYGQNGYLDVIKEKYETHPELCQLLYKSMKSRFLGVVMNQIRDNSDITVGSSMSKICREFFGLNSHYLGSLNYDETVVRSLKNRSLVGESYPHSIFMRKLKKVKEQSINLLDIRGLKI